MDLSAGDNYALRFAASHGHAHVVELLCGLPRSANIDVSARTNEALRQAACHGHMRVVELLCGLPLERGVDPSVYAPSPVVTAAQNGYAGCGRVLYNLPHERGAAPHSLYAAARNGHTEVVRFLCNLPRGRGATNVRSVNKALSCAAYNGHVAVVVSLCSHLAANQILACCTSRALVLSTVATRGHWDVVWVLLRSQPDSFCSDVLQLAATYGKLDIVMFITERLYARRSKCLGKYLSAAVRYAVYKGHADIVKALCNLPPEYGVSVAGRDCVQAAAFHADRVTFLCTRSLVKLAAWCGHAVVVRYLCSLPLHLGVDPSANNYLYEALSLPDLCTDVAQADVVGELCVALRARDAWQPRAMMSALQEAVDVPELRRFRCILTMNADALCVSSLLRDKVHTWPAPFASVVRQELNWRRRRPLLGIARLLRIRRASGRTGGGVMWRGSHVGCSHRWQAVQLLSSMEDQA